MTDHPESSHGVLVDLPGARCEEFLIFLPKTQDTPSSMLGLDATMCDGALQVFSRTRPPRQAICSRCSHVSYEVPLGDVA